MTPRTGRPTALFLFVVMLAAAAVARVAVDPVAAVIFTLTSLAAAVGFGVVIATEWRD